MFDVKDKVLFITGGAAGIGAGVVREFLNEGAKHVAILDVDVKTGNALVEELTSKHGEGKAKFYKCDVTTNELEEAYDAVIKDQGYIDVVINNAGILNDSPNVYEKQIAINVTALIKSSLRAYHLMRKDHDGSGGTIINISSIAALYQPKILPIYGATKSAVLQFSNCLGSNLHYERSDVRVVTLCFGCTSTALFNNIKTGTIDKETDEVVGPALQQSPWQKTENAVNGLMHAYKNGESGSTWLVSSGRSAEDITANVNKAYEILSEGVFY